MAIALAAAPVIYAWYLLYFTPFLLTAVTVPLTAWTITVIPTYIVWRLAYEHGSMWAVPSGIMQWEYAIPIVVAAVVAKRAELAEWVNRFAPQRKPAEPVEPSRS